MIENIPKKVINNQQNQLKIIGDSKKKELFNKIIDFIIEKRINNIDKDEIINDFINKHSNLNQSDNLETQLPTIYNKYIIFIDFIIGKKNSNIKINSDIISEFCTNIIENDKYKEYCNTNDYSKVLRYLSRVFNRYTIVTKKEKEQQQQQQQQQQEKQEKQEKQQPQQQEKQQPQQQEATKDNVIDIQKNNTHNELYNTAISTLYQLSDIIKSGQNIPNARIKLEVINRILGELQIQSVINFDTKKKILNDIDNINNNFDDIQSPFFYDNMNPKDTNNNEKKTDNNLNKLTELINTVDIKQIIKKYTEDLNQITKEITERSNQDLEFLNKNIENLKKEINKNTEIINNYNIYIQEIQKNIDVFKKYIDSFKDIDFEFTDTQFYPEECITTEMIKYSTDNSANNDNPTSTLTQADIALIISSLQKSLDFLNKKASKLSFNIYRNPKLLEKLMGGGKKFFGLLNGTTSNNDLNISEKKLHVIDAQTTEKLHIFDKQIEELKKQIEELKKQRDSPQNLDMIDAPNKQIEKLIQIKEKIKQIKQIKQIEEKIKQIEEQKKQIVENRQKEIEEEIQKLKEERQKLKEEELKKQIEAQQNVQTPPQPTSSSDITDTLETQSGENDENGEIFLSYITLGQIDSNIIMKGTNTNTNNEYTNLMIDYITQVQELKQLLYKFQNKCREYNIEYVKMYNHLSFIIDYLGLVQQNNNTNYLIYEYIGLNTVIYYKQIVDKIIQDMKKKTPLGNFFTKYYCINIYILYYFLSKLIDNWQQYSSNNICDKINANIDAKIDINIKKVVSKLHLYDNDFIFDPQIKKGVFIFNAMKDLLDKNKSLTSPPVAVYLRINKIPSDESLTEVFKKDTDPKNIGKLSNETIKKCNNNNTDIGNIQFAEIFDSETFNDNAVLSKYMSIPTFLSQGKSIMVLTYGYSGVGKTFTVFGGNGKNGMLQSSLNSIQQKKAIYYRAYELYGIAFPYKSYWQKNDGTPKETKDYHHCIYHYTEDNKSYNAIEIKAGEMNDFISKINTTEPEKYDFKQITTEELNKFSKIINKIDEIRKKEGRIRWTVNNPQSSRSIMIFDFKIKLTNDSFVNFVIVDLPGKENIKETFVDQESCIKLKKEYNCVYDENRINQTPTNTLIIDYNDKTLLDKTLLDYTRNMAFLSPLALMLNEKFANILINKKYENSNKTFIDYIINIKNQPFIFTFKGEDYNYKDKDDNTKSIREHMFTYDNDRTSILNASGSYNIRVGLEIMRNIINNNRFDLLENFYNEIFEFAKDSQNCTNTNYLNAPFEGYYINENIIGLLSTLLTHLNLSTKNVIEEQINQFTELKNNVDFTNETKYKDKDKGIQSYLDKIDTEIKAQTYFFRFLSREKISKIQNIEFTYIYKKIHKNTVIYGKKIHQWIDESYDYNKTFNLKNPPIASLLQPYFNNNTINNFYLFYVVSNNNPEKCDKQIKLINDSKKFLDKLTEFSSKQPIK